MKHNLKITAVLLAMFIITQFIGLYVVNHYTTSGEELPYGMETPQIEQEKDFYYIFPSLLIAFVIAISLLIFLNKLQWDFVLKAWFFVVIVIALGITLTAPVSSLKYASLIAFLIALPLAWLKIYGNNLLVHNATELLVYPGIAAVFVPILNIWTIVILLIVISIYDMWAVWHSGIMQKMAQYQIQKLNVFSGFFVPYTSKKVRDKIKSMKKNMSKKQLKEKKIKVNIAILGGGDVIFPIITSGVVLRVWGLIPALLVIAGATLGLGYLFFFAEKKKFYPAMPFISAGIFLGMLIGWFLL